MAQYVADATIKQLVLSGKVVKNAKVAILGITFKENCPDVRNSKVVDIVKRLREYGIEPIICDPWAAPQEIQREYHLQLAPITDAKELDCLILAVAHEEFKALIANDLDIFFKDIPNNEKVIIDIKNMCSLKELQANNYRFWRL